MKIFRKRVDLSSTLKRLKQKGKTIGFVPTMGALHEGHISLIAQSRKKSDITVCSIFVNPTQFNDPRDLEKYPRPVSRDIEMLVEANCDILYLPETNDVYPAGMEITQHYKIGPLEHILEGASRQGHFAGVVRVVSVLLRITTPDYLFLGQKDYQQFTILSDFVRRKKLKTKVIRCPIAREKNGLAMSSRNARLSPELRGKASIIYETLKRTAKMIGKKSIENLLAESVNRIESEADFKVDYFELRDAKTLEPVTSVNKATSYILITSVIVGGVRLLDNILTGKQGKP